jgi:hypothetical protein
MAAAAPCTNNQFEWRVQGAPRDNVRDRSKIAVELKRICRVASSSSQRHRIASSIKISTRHLVACSLIDIWI